MQALYLQNNQLSLKSDYAKPTPAAGEALIRVTRMGICSTDLELIKGYYPYDGVLGHEFVGIVDTVEDEANAEWVGKRVVSTINLSPKCNGSCDMRCPEQCPHRTVLGIVNKDGVFANYITLPIVNLLVVPDSVSTNQAVFTEPLAAAIRITEQTKIDGKAIAVIGPGRLGMLIAQVLRHFGGNVTVLGRSKKSLELPADLGFPTRYSDSVKLGTYDLVVEATASPAGFRQAVALVRPNGAIILKSTYADDPNQPLFKNIGSLFATIVVNEITLIGSRCGPFDKALDLLEQNVIQVTPFIEAEYSLADGLAAFEHAAQPGVRKILLRP
ncbi:MAG: MDR/zinc-dependent alcohol dehydrogenase-like family protein [Candidatus Promineifilaceae bacterium]